MDDPRPLPVSVLAKLGDMVYVDEESKKDQTSTESILRASAWRQRGPQPVSSEPPSLPSSTLSTQHSAFISLKMHGQLLCARNSISVLHILTCKTLGGKIDPVIMSFYNKEKIKASEKLNVAPKVTSLAHASVGTALSRISKLF